jgi:hypothetical protein
MHIISKIALFPLFFLTLSNFAQQKAISQEDAIKFGIDIEKLDQNYKSAIHSDTTKAVFKSEEDQQKLQKVYNKLIQDFNSFLSQNGFKWEKKTRCFQRIYFSSDGTIDYFIYNFKLKSVLPNDIPTEEKQAEFKRLLSLFIKDYVFELKAKIPFAQCSPTLYQ